MTKFSCAMIVALSLGAVGCKKREQERKAAPEPVAAVAPTPTTPPEPPKPTEAERVAEALKKADADAAEEAKRWTDDLKKQSVELRDKKYKDASEALTAFLASPHRVPGNKDRDAARHPVETLAFFGIKPTDTVVELGAGGGWYTELLAPLVYAKGKLVVAGPDAKGPADKMSTVYGKRLDLFLAKSPDLFGKVERVAIGSPVAVGAPASADLVIAIREMHNWQRRDELDAYLAAVHAVLKDGGTFGMVAHRAAAGTKVEDTVEKGYLAEDWVIEKVKAAGFELVEKSEVNANPKDTRDYEKGVWTLPPNFALGETDKAKYTEIGESDRMTLKFKKVAKK
ncbi:MAG: class I SAM-dependent methyltransferase [Kofleriaceae bacterium]